MAGRNRWGGWRGGSMHLPCFVLLRVSVSESLCPNHDPAALLHHGLALRGRDDHWAGVVRQIGAGCLESPALWGRVVRVHHLRGALVVRDALAPGANQSDDVLPGPRLTGPYRSVGAKMPEPATAGTVAFEGGTPYV